MPKKIDPEIKARALRLWQDHGAEYPNPTAAASAVAKQVGVGRETVRRWIVQAQVDAGARDGMTTEEHDEVKRLKAGNRRLARSAMPTPSMPSGTPHGPLAVTGAAS